MNKKEETLNIDMDRAWSRLMDRVKEEPAPEAWKHLRNKGPQTYTTPTEAAENPLQPISVLPPMKEESGLKLPDRKAYRWIKRYAVPAMAACLVVVLAITPLGGKVMASVMQQFRVKHLSGVQLTGQELDKLQSALQTGVQQDQTFQLEKFGKLEIAGGGKPQQMTASEAESQLGKQVVLFPGMNEAAQVVSVQPAMNVSMSLHIAEVNEMLRTLGGSKSLPPSADNQPIELRVPAVITVVQESGGGSAAKSLYQLDAPEIDVPADVDVDQVRSAVLDLPFLPDSLRNKLKGTVDWRNTLLVPMPPDGQTRELEINGYSAVLRSGEEGKRGLMWLQNGKVFLLTGGNQAYPTDDSIIQEAQGLIGS